MHPKARILNAQWSSVSVDWLEEGFRRGDHAGSPNFRLNGARSWRHWLGLNVRVPRSIAVEKLVCDSVGASGMLATTLMELKPDC